MSKLLCVVGVCLLAGLPAVAHAQTTGVSKNLVMSVKGGVSQGSVSDLSPDDIGLDADADPIGRTGAVGGVVVFYALTEHVGLQGEVLYVQKGGGFKYSGTYDGTSFDDKFRYKLDYIELPLLARVTLTRGRLRPYVSGGAMFAVRTGYTMSNESTSGGKTIKGEVGYDPTPKSIRDTDYGVVVGGGLAYRRLFVEGRYTIGMRNVFGGADTAIKNRALTVMVGADF